MKDTLKNMWANASDQIIPTLLEALRQLGESSETVPQALRQEITSVSGAPRGESRKHLGFRCVYTQVLAATVFHVFIPRLIAMSMTAFNARALTPLITVKTHSQSDFTQLQRTFFEPVSDPSIIVASTSGGF